MTKHLRDRDGTCSRVPAPLFLLERMKLLAGRDFLSYFLRWAKWWPQWRILILALYSFNLSVRLIWWCQLPQTLITVGFIIYSFIHLPAPVLAIVLLLKGWSINYLRSISQNLIRETEPHSALDLHLMKILKWFLHILNCGKFTFSFL